MKKHSTSFFVNNTNLINKQVSEPRKLSKLFKNDGTDKGGSLNSLKSESGSSWEDSDESVGSSFYLDRLNTLTMSRILLT